MGEHREQRKAFWDDYSGRFYFDSKTEAIQRTSRRRERHAECVNRSSGKILETNLKLIRSARGIIQGKYDREMNSARLNLKDLVSYRLVLQKIAQKNQANPWHETNLGQYGTHASYFEVSNKRHDVQTEMDPMWKRQELARKLTAGRRPMQVVDRKLSTDDLFLSLHRARSVSAGGPLKRKTSARRAGLKLPPITATKTTKLDPDTTPDNNNNKSNRNHVFVTQKNYVA